MWFFVSALALVFAGAAAQSVSQLGDRCSRDYACPPKYLKVAQQCYYFSKNRMTWQDAFFACQDLHGKFAVIKNLHQSKLLRNFLDKVSIVDAERWIGGMYDWEQMLWKWGSSGLQIRYKDFIEMEPEDKEKLKWNCISLDPANQYKWAPRSCLEEKHFICQTRLKRAHGSKTKKGWPYDQKKYHDLNEVLDPSETRNSSVYNSLKEHQPNGVNDIEFEDYDDNAFARRANATTIDRRSKKKKNRKRLLNKKKFLVVHNGTEPVYEHPELKSGETRRNRRNKSKEDEENASVETDVPNSRVYYSDQPKSPLHPRVLIEEVSFP